MASWSAENATNAYLTTINNQGSKTGTDPNGAEYISALAAGSNAQFMVVACGGTADSTAVALLAAAHQTGGRVICILRSEDELLTSRITLGTNAAGIEFVVGDAYELVSNVYKESDLVAVDCTLEKHEEIMSRVQQKSKRIVLGYNALCKDSAGEKKKKSSLTSHQLLPIGQGLLVARRLKTSKTNNWVFTVDKCTGEQHVFRVRSRNIIRT